MSKRTYVRVQRVVAVILMFTGVLGIVFSITFWALTGRVELAFLPFFAMIAGVGTGVDLMREITESRRAATEDDE